MTKFYRASERSWKDGLTLEALHKVACRSVGREDAHTGVNFPDPEQEEIDREVKAMFALGKRKQKPASSSSLILPIAVTSSSPPARKRKTREDAEPEPGWLDENLDGSNQGVSPERTRNRPRKEQSESSVEQPVTPTPQPLSVKTNVPAMGLGSPVSLEKPRTKTKTKTKNKMVSVKQECVSPLVCSGSNSNQPSKSLNSSRTATKKAPESIIMKSEAHSVTPSKLSTQGHQVQVKESTLVWFARTRDERCEAYRSWKKDTEWDQRTHTFDALLHGCGWTARSAKEKVELEDHWVKQGIVVIDECDGYAADWQRGVKQALNRIASSNTNSSSRNEIVVFGCRSRTEPLYRVM